MCMTVKENKLLLNSSVNATPIHRLAPFVLHFFAITPLANAHHFLIWALSFSVYPILASLFACTQAFLFSLLEYQV